LKKPAPAVEAVSPLAAPDHEFSVAEAFSEPE
jgi:hypothetical protein